MAAFSIFTRDAEQAEEASLDPQGPAVLDYRRESPNEVEDSEGLDIVGDIEDGPSGRIVLRLPDLASSQPVPMRSLIMPQLFWVAIILGFLLAAVLIWGGPKPAPQEIDELPARSGQTPWRPYAPIGGPLGPEQPPEGIRAARRVDVPRDTNSSPAMPGVATPVGTIITGAPE